MSSESGVVLRCWADALGMDTLLGASHNVVPGPRTSSGDSPGQGGKGQGSDQLHLGTYAPYGLEAVRSLTARLVSV